MPEPLLLGRDPAKLEALADAHGIARWTMDLDAALGDPAYEIFFDAASTQLRAGLLRRAIAAGKHVYCEKPAPRASTTRLRSGAPPRRPASGTAWSRTSSGCRG